MTHPSADRYYRSPIARLTISRPSPQPEFTTMRCHGCGSEMSIRIDLARLWIGRTYTICYPCLKAPYICAACREDPRKLDKTRKAMEQHWATCKGGNSQREIGNEGRVA